jgi:peptidoglycan/LPS O-acetylase OafA/YrhL
MTINTNVQTGSIASLDRRAGATTFAAMFGLGLLGLTFGKRKSMGRRIPTLLCLLLFSAIMAGISGCSTQQLGGPSGTTTPAGTYTVLVTAKQVGSQVITSSGVTTTVYGDGNQMSLPFSLNVTVQ